MLSKWTNSQIDVENLCELWLLLYNLYYLTTTTARWTDFTASKHLDIIYVGKIPRYTSTSLAFVSFSLEILELFYYQRCCKADWKQTPCVFYDSEDKAWLLKRKKEIICYNLARSRHLPIFFDTFSWVNTSVLLEMHLLPTEIIDYYFQMHDFDTIISIDWKSWFFCKYSVLKCNVFPWKDAREGQTTQTKWHFKFFSSFDIYLYSTEEKL